MTEDASMAAPLDQDALYYPYISVNDAAWLKATLLCFPHVYRMIPTDFVPTDDKFVVPFTKTLGTRNEPLLQAVTIDYSYAFPEQAYLRARLESDIDAEKNSFIERYTAQRTAAEFGRADVFQLYRLKILDELFFLLKDHDLIWPAGKKGDKKWFAMHPILGEAIMSTIAVAIAQANGLHIVTNSEPKHRELFMRSTDQIYDSLVHGRGKSSALPEAELTHRLAQLVIVSNFDVDRLSPEQIVAVSNETTAFRDLKNRLIEESKVAWNITDPATRDARLKAAAGRVVTQWEESKPTASKYLKSLFSLGLLDAGESALKEAATSTLVGLFGGAATQVAGAAAAIAVPPVVLAVAPGLAVAVVYYGISTAVKQRSKANESQYRFLTKVEKAGALYMASPALAQRGRP